MEDPSSLHHRRFLQRNHSIDVIQSAEGDDSDSEGTSIPPNEEEEESVLRPLDSVELGFSVSALGASGSASGGGGAESAHTPHLQTALERAVSRNGHGLELRA